MLTVKYARKWHTELEKTMATDMIADKIEGWERQAYGTTLKNVDNQIQQSEYFKNREVEYLAMSILSDAQELLEMAEFTATPYGNAARQKMNVVKHILDIYLKTASVGPSHDRRLTGDN
jgi:hypothetical protein